MANDSRSRDLVLAPGEYAFLLDKTNGVVNTATGPYKTSMADTVQPVVWSKNIHRFSEVDTDKAKQTNTIAPEGFYIALYNPASIPNNPNNPLSEHPREGTSSSMALLNVGHRVNIPGPANFPLWPGQMAEVIKGHHLRSNQYLVVQVYNDGEATKNWQKAVLKPQESAESIPVEPRSFAPGQLLIIKGTEVAFFIPPTGVKVVPESEKIYVREAVTLERLEYCILLDEDGNKRFVRGPDVVFPEPTEHFVEKLDDDGKLARKFRAIELNETTGIYVKVIAPYEENGVTYKVGDELFITGKEQAIYFQREEHSIIRYGDQTKHYGVALPAGEGRYVLDRVAGNVALTRGPKMFLPDPRTELIIRRVLSEKTARLWYPNNENVVRVNKELDTFTKKDDPSSYVVSAGLAGASVSSTYSMTTVESPSNRTSRQIAGDIFKRGTAFTPPRTIILDTKYEGAVSISVWTGYAVLVINKTGGRKVVVGPETILLEYDETLAQLEFSTGTPKTDAKLVNSVYLRVGNNRISDIINVETSDLVNVQLHLSYRVNFEGEDPERWFAVENYVKLLCDHIRSIIRNVTKRRGIESFYAHAADIIRDAVLGEAAEAGAPRAGRLFAENNMRIYDVEVLNVLISDTTSAGMLREAQADTLRTAMALSKQERLLNFTQRTELMNRHMAEAKNATVLATQALLQAEIEAQLAVSLRRLTSEAEVTAVKLNRQMEEQPMRTSLNASELERQKASDTQRLGIIEAELQLEINRLHSETEEITNRT